MDDSLDDFYNKYHINLIAIFGIIVVIYIVIFSLFNNASFNTPEARPWILFVEILMWGLFIAIIYLNIKHFSKFEYNFNDIMFNLFGTKRAELHIHAHKSKDASNNSVKSENKSESKTSITNNSVTNIINSGARDISNNATGKVETKTIIKEGPEKRCKPGEVEVGEVFHISQNKYKYEDAEDACALFDARLATYDEVEDAYKNGANWCNYGWSSDQLALFPIQKSMYNELKKIPGHERDCGRTGVNGGYMEDKDLRFGVNCYGKKPYAGEDDLEYMKKFKFSPAYPDSELKKKQLNDKMDKMLIAPFNKDKWNEY